MRAAALRIPELVTLTPGERVVLLDDSSTRAFTDVLADVLGDQLTQRFDLDQYDRPLGTLPDEILDALKVCDVCIYIIAKRGTAQRSELAMRRKVHRVVESRGGRCANVLGASPSQIAQALDLDPFAVRDQTMAVLDHMRGVRRVRVTTPSGTDAVFTFSPEYSWLASTGFVQAGRTRNLVPAEVYTYPSGCEGRIVVQGTYGYLGYREEFRDPEETLARLREHPVTLDIADGRIVSVSCSDPAIKEAVESQVFSGPESDRIGEFGLGTNPNVKDFTGVMAIDEKKPGVHVAHGHGYPASTGAPYNCPVHYDFVLDDPTVTDLDSSKALFSNGEFDDSLRKC